MGWWGDEAPLGLVDPNWRVADRAPLIQYLRSGIVVTQYFGLSWCRFRCGAIEMGSRDLSDGEWIWPEGLAHYLNEHSLSLPDEFAGHAINNGFAIDRSLQLEELEVHRDPRLWARWCAGRGFKYTGIVQTCDPLKHEIVRELREIWLQAFGAAEDA